MKKSVVPPQVPERLFELLASLSQPTIVLAGEEGWDRATQKHLNEYHNDYLTQTYLTKGMLERFEGL